MQFCEVGLKCGQQISIGEQTWALYFEAHSFLFSHGRKGSFDHEIENYEIKFQSLGSLHESLLSAKLI